jgi:hypothetical protein
MRRQRGKSGELWPRVALRHRCRGALISGLLDSENGWQKLLLGRADENAEQAHQYCPHLPRVIADVIILDQLFVVEEGTIAVFVEALIQAQYVIDILGKGTVHKLVEVLLCLRL